MLMISQGKTAVMDRDFKRDQHLKIKFYYETYTN